jgi:hypothetical protein
VVLRKQWERFNEVRQQAEAAAAAPAAAYTSREFRPLSPLSHTQSHSPLFPSLPGPFVQIPRAAAAAAEEEGAHPAAGDGIETS